MAFPKDRVLKIIVYFVYFLELFQTILVTLTRSYASGIGDYDALVEVRLLWYTLPWTVMSAIAKESDSGSFWMVSCIGQLFFAYRIHVLSQSKVTYDECSAIVIAFTLTGTAGGLMTGYRVKQSGRMDHLNNVPTTIAGALFRGRSSTTSGRIRSIISKLIRLIIETGMVTATVATPELFLYIGFPDSTFCTAPILILPKAYANTIFVILNSRFRIIGGRDEENYGTVDAVYPGQSMLEFGRGLNQMSTSTQSTDRSISTNQCSTQGQLPVSNKPRNGMEMTQTSEIGAL
ncbi:hypothetical protein K435DRAFT_870226 [Dendrothele bispora CBS 962.96]|uniref:DUF6534 domain-containing protein n=1 Tax=Dendrothele bispora (strain CBS 962.96) TaxID=1314807 RepID=A0A4S8L733_DENBC|nr:hypothetical protein K435DRAFT_870226 [Dendrothele bispora CBS 962.96]